MCFTTFWVSGEKPKKSYKNVSSKWYFKIVSNFTHLRAREITYNNFEISLVVFMPEITTNHVITYINLLWSRRHYGS